jgi:hypothetical protein
VKPETLIFATHRDYSSGLALIEEELSLSYTVAGVFNTNVPLSFLSALDIPNLGSALTGDANHEADYLVMHADTPIAIEPVMQRAGGVRYFIDLERNPSGIHFRPSGMFEEKAVIRGRVARHLNNPKSATLYRVFVKTLTTGFKNVKGFLVGPEAYDLLKEGRRLTARIRSPAEYDLRLN